MRLINGVFAGGRAGIPIPIRTWRPAPGRATIRTLTPMPNRSPHPFLLLAGAAAVTAAAAAIDAFLIEPARVEVTHHELPLVDLPSEWRGARLVHLTDLHYGNPRSRALHRWMVRTVNALEPDLVVLTGDYAVRRAGEGRACAAYLGELR